MKTMSEYTSAIIIISDEILSGKSIEFNSKYLCEALQELKFKVKKVTILPRNENLITFEVQLLFKQFDVVIVTVLDNSNDVCCKAVAKAFQQKLKTVVIDNTEVFIPISARLLTVNSSKRKVFPIIHVQGLFMLKGNLDCIKSSFTNILKPRLLKYINEPSFGKTFHIKFDAKYMSMIKNFVNGNVKLEMKQLNNELIVDVTSTNFSALSQLEEHLQEKLENNLISSERKIELNNLYYEEQESYLKQSLEVIEECLTEYGVENVFLSFNGGKDCTVLLHLVLTVIETKFPEYKNPLFCVYVQSQNSFPEQNSFITQCKNYYNLDVMTISKNMKDALALVIERKPYVKACLMGTRRTDPFSNSLQTFQMTDPDWPSIMRVNPILDWHYSDIWEYLLYFKVPYCNLYDAGYTSIGNVSNTVQNPLLLWYDILNDTEKYLPAYKLLDASKEREGRL